MQPSLLIVTLGGILVLSAAFVALIHRLGGFRSSPQERRNWTVLGVVLVVWIGVLGFFSFLPYPLLLLLGTVVAIAYLGIQRIGRLGLGMPPGAEEELARRRHWMGAHRGLLIGIGITWTILVVIWTIVIAVVTRAP